MKRILYVLIGITILTGCSCTASMGNTPTKKVEEFLNKYQTNDADVVSDLDDVLTSDTTLTADEQSDYSDFMKTHYQNLKYKIKDETIDGDSATVNAEITVKNYSDAINEANQYRLNNADEFDSTNTFASYRLKKLKEVDKEETYTITFNLTKTDDEWKINDLSDDDLDKINGVYGVSTIYDTTNTDTDTDTNDTTNENDTDTTNNTDNTTTAP